MSRNSLGDAIALYEDFHDGPASGSEVVEIEFPEMVFQVGTCDGILYTADRGDGPEEFIHEFEGDAKPMLCATPDGKQLLLIGGNFEFTERGIEDK